MHSLDDSIDYPVSFGLNSYNFLLVTNLESYVDNPLWLMIVKRGIMAGFDLSASICGFFLVMLEGTIKHHPFLDEFHLDQGAGVHYFFCIYVIQTLIGS